MNLLLAALWRRLHLSKYIQLHIMRFFQDQFLIGVTGIIFNNRKEILLVKHTYRGIWSLPGGYIKAAEHPKEGLEREIEEETGFTVSVDEEMKIRTDRETARLDICFIGIYIAGEFRKSDEVSEVGFFPFENLPLLPKNQLFLMQEAIKTKNVFVSH